MPSADHRLQPRRKPRQVRAELTRERILTAAAHVFAEYGYAAGTTNRIAEHARISIGSLYQYFPNKDAILAELLVRHIDRGRWTRADQLDLSPGSLEAAVRALVRDAVHNHRDDPQLLRIMIEEAPLSKELLATIERHGKARVGQVRDLLDRHADVQVRDLDTAAELIVFTVEMNTHKLMADPRNIPVETFENELVDMVTRYLRGDR
ncbi:MULTISPECIES: TetR/AcrR family transcriptional regulator [unclassified Streptomyces]|uniref:TetR/AcrR family transcriptional regulator n=1 Tax=Streptomyces TaxID=1883 RepID=UPI0001C1AB9E|nr:MULTISPECIES: TetR/AcrR family transcriptional regulator [unclassified Streptomyces]AEN08412.1 transcriptional regulator, TetR family [Streptomyces sp. SirexAA-E]MYR69345.1 TetR family transcriptional regulator [Streptomyces sp. SID4939]MYS02140.1 TetR family transcriptional regulator [Streptomyces sp. SID4940]MYT66443.1 TetR family transcriptional regulator [Streptomyces sp. SID8357]MYT83364.1 TetR family transcriptional regulator [Streptomyces sp. SID8360]